MNEPNAEAPQVDQPQADNRNGRQIIPEALLIERLERSDDMREFFIQMWLQNPGLAKQGGARVREILAPLESTITNDPAPE
ncbi:MAG: hypothetical protein ACKVQK_16135 [Burkholderiales bacterium]